MQDRDSTSDDVASPSPMEPRPARSRKKSLASVDSTTVLRNLKPRTLVKCWATARRPDGECLTLHEVEVLVQRWLEVFGEQPPTMPGTVPHITGLSKGGGRLPAGCQILRRKHVADLLGVKVQALDRMVESGQFPKPLRVGKRLVGWPRNQIDLVLNHQRRIAA